MDGADGVEQFVGFGVLTEEAAGAGEQCFEHVLVDLERGEDEYADAGEAVVGGDHAGGGEPVKVRHADVHDDYVGPGLAGLLHGCSAGADLCDDIPRVAGASLRRWTAPCRRDRE